MTTIELPLNWGTWIDANGQSATHGSDSFLQIGSTYSTWARRSLMNFNYNGIPGEIQSASLNFYVSDTGGSSLLSLRVWRITRECTSKATWLVSPQTAWHEAGAENMNNDRNQNPLTSTYQIKATGWHSIPITSLTQLQLLFDGLKTLLLREENSRPAATISKTTNAPYLAIDYKSSLVGGVQII